MKKFDKAFAGLVFSALLAAGPLFADSDAIRTMATIAMSMNHYPSDEDKAALKAIIDSDEASEDEADIALAISNMQHQLSAADGERMNDIANDESSDPAARQLAKILLGFNHAAGDADKAALATLASN